MRWTQTLGLRLRSLFRPGRVEHELDEEMRFHLEQQIERDIAAGLTPAEARAAALREFGGVDQIKEACRDERRVSVVDHLARDVRYAARVLRRDAGFSVVASATIALGIGVSTAMFTIVHSVLLKPLPYVDPDRLTMVYTVSDRGLFKFRDGNFTDAGYLEVKNSRSFAQLAAFDMSVSALTGVGEPARVPHAGITADLLPLLGVRPALGRGFLTGEDTAGHSQVALLGDRLWRSHFAADPGVLGRTIHLDGESYTVVGVMPPDFGFPSGPQSLTSPDVWTPIVLDPTYTANTRRHVVGRLAPGVTVARAEAELLTLSQHPTGGYAQPSRAGIRVAGLKESLVGDVRQLLLIFLGAVGLVLLVACANVANLLLARGAGRAKELALRAALGASRWRLVQQLLTESAVLTLLGGVAGLGVARAVIAFVLQLVPPKTLPRAAEVGMDARVFAFTGLVCLVTALAIGAMPAYAGASKDVNEPLQEGAGRSTARGVSRLRGALVVAEVALVLVLLAGAGLLARSFWLLQHVDPGFRPDAVLTMQIALPDAVYRTIEQRKAFYEQVLARMNGVPAAADASLVNLLPFGDMGWRGDFEIEGGTKPQLLVGKPAVSSDYFKALAIPLLRGRYFEARDGDGSPRVAIVSDIVARRCWPGLDAIGRRLRMDSSRPDRWLTVVGIVADVKQNNLGAEPQPTIYVPYQQEWRAFFLANMAFLVRVTGSRDGAADEMRHAVHAIDPDLPATNVAMLDQLLSRSIAEPRFRTSVLATFAALAMALACVGIAGLVAYDVARRTREIGIRLALGAQATDVVGLVMRRSVTLVAAGVLVGLPGTLAVGQLLSTFLYGVAPGDPATLAIVSVCLIAAGVIAAFVPARRATRIEPVMALRDE